jgi:1-acyl-sn-glycerol-3-phosphate acyltransferase
MFFCKFFFKLEVHGKECIPLDFPFIIAANHLSYLDPIIIGVASPVKLWFLAKEDLFKNKFFGRYLNVIGTIPLVRGRGDIRALRRALSLLKERKPVVIFPQGQRGDRDAAKPGVGFLYRKTGVPVIAAHITGTEKALPKGARMIRYVKVIIRFSPVEDISESDSYEDISYKVLRMIMK